MEYYSLKGGSHLSNEQSVFSFELNETLYFEKGQEVAEIKGISLDPEISIQSFNEYISIRGVIELRGEYQKIIPSDQDNYTNDFEEYHSNRYVESVVDTEDGAAEFSHRFPVEISIPSYRVMNLNDVTVSIASFDYEIPDQSQLKLYSTINIDGINSQTEVTHEEEEEEEEEEEKVDETFQFEIKEEPDKESPDVIESINPGNIPALSTDSEIEEESIEDTPRWKNKKSQTLKEFFDSLSSVEEETSPEYPDDHSPYHDVEESYEEYESMESRSESVEDVSYLSDMFRNTEEEQYTKMKLCIVQDKDTIETIAERYQISALQLIKQNQLDDEYTVSEGQLLYIPYNRK